MGILDDAIRQHLDLKRRHGAAEAELKQLEDEAFGPPTRPGEPDFPTRPDEQGTEQPAGEAPPTAEAPLATQAEAPPATREPAAMEHPVVEPQAEEVAAAPPTEEAVEPVPEEPVAEPAPPEAEAPAEEEPEPTAFYDQTKVEELDLGDLDLDLEEEIEEGLEEIGGEKAADQGEPPAADVVDVDTVEHEAPEPEPEPEPEPAPEPAPEPTPEEPPAAEEEDSGDEDVLEETPEFLQDRPEDDDLWFEQGKPKDFDF